MLHAVQQLTEPLASGHRASAILRAPRGPSRAGFRLLLPQHESAVLGVPIPGAGLFGDGLPVEVTALFCYDSTVAITTRSELLAALAGHRAEIRELGAKSLHIFGSFARGEVRPESDVDVLVEFSPGQKTYDRFLRLGILLETVSGRRVELVTPEGLSPYIGPKIQREAIDVPLGS